MIIFRRAAQEHYDQNLQRDLSAMADPDGALNGQGRGELGRLSFGRASVARAGCEALAIYNALLFLSCPRPLPEIIRDLEQGGYMRFRGHLGAVPWIQPLLKRYGVSCRAALPYFIQRDADLGLLEPGSVFLLCLLNDRLRPQKGMHTVAAVYEPGEGGDWHVFNRFNSDRTRRRFRALRDILRNGRSTGAYAVIFRLRRL